MMQKDKRRGVSLCSLVEKAETHVLVGLFFLYWECQSDDQIEFEMYAQALTFILLVFLDFFGSRTVSSSASSSAASSRGSGSTTT